MGQRFLPHSADAVHSADSPQSLRNGDRTRRGREVCECAGQVHNAGRPCALAQKVVCHFDEFRNFTYVINGTKTFVLAPFDKVLFGPEKEPNTNRKVETSSSDFSRAVISPGQLLYLPKNWCHEVSLAYSDTYVSFSSSTIGMHYTDSRTDSPQSFLFFPDTAAGEDKPRRCFEFGDRIAWIKCYVKPGSYLAFISTIMRP